MRENFKEVEHQKEHQKEDEEIFQQYMEGMDLKPEDFDKKILDVGSGSGKFAKWAKEHHVGSEICSVEPYQELQEKSKAVRGRIEEAPFKDEQFDLVISFCAIPQIFSSIESSEVMEEKIKQSLLEMLRVTKKDGEIRFGPVTNGEAHEFQKRFREILNNVLEELKAKQHVTIEEVPRGDIITKSDEEGNPLLKEPSFLIKIRRAE